MKVSYNWLKDYCAFDLAANELAEGLSQAGLNVETYEPVGDDHMLDVEVTTNRPDCLSHVGLAREMAALTGTRVAHPPAEVAEDGELQFGVLSSVRVTCKDQCPHYTARLIRGVRVGPSPEWLQKRLETCGVRPVNNVVDVTNYVLLETGQPLHAFDMARLDGGRIVVRRPRKGEKITTIDGTECELAPDMCLIADASKPVAVGGVMGGLGSEISESTTDVLLESARFAPANIRRTARALRLSSESSYRFERGVDPEGVEHASRRAARLILELAGGRLASGLGEVRAGRTPKRTVTMRYARMALVLGLEVKPDEVLRIFEGLELEITKHSR
ncbi:MAG: phenylalanine--tRNA ligase subunit beta, partial [Candidatus Brocadiia bacterium]|nr:phenylalanine--tRNA ligase subunit beta [Candidatus Brocadiia bacterium]